MLAPPPKQSDWALFLDIDGTLLEIADAPQGVFVPAALKQLLSQDALDREGALALVSGRRLADIDALFAPLHFPAAGQHGLERRDAAGRVSRLNLPPAVLANARAALNELAAEHPGLVVEDKGAAIALHYRQAPQLETLTRDTMARIAATLPDFHVQPGKCVWELKPRAASKATAIRDFMKESPFAGRLPVFAGDDFTDENGFAAVNELGGISILVGQPRATAAKYGIESVATMVGWLARR